MSIYIGGTPLMLNMNGADASTVFTDSSDTPKTVVAVGGAKISTAQSKFGGSSALFDGAGDYLDIAGPLGWNPAGKDYTVEAWAYFNSLANDPYLIQAGDSTSNATGLHWVNGSAYWWTQSQGSGGDYFGSSQASAVGVWEHWLIRKVGTTLRMFKDGVQVGGYDYCAIPSFSASAGVSIGYKKLGGGAGNYFNGYIEDVRILSLARVTTNFTPPTAELAAIPPAQVVPTLAGGRLGKLSVGPDRQAPTFAARPADTTDRLVLGAPQNSYERSLSPATNAMQFKGRGKIVGTVKTKNSPTNLPVQRRVRLYREPDGLLVRTVWSDPTTGVYEFIGIPMGATYTVVSHDYTGAFRAVLADGLVPDPAT